VKDEGQCDGDSRHCPKCYEIVAIGRLGKPGRDGKRRIKGCNDPVARGRRNRTKGDTKARVARKQLGLSATGKAGSRHEEHWTGAFRTEVKAGAQVGPIATRFNQARLQSEGSKTVGDNRPFVMVAMPNGSADGIVLISLSEFKELINKP